MYYVNITVRENAMPGTQYAIKYFKKFVTILFQVHIQTIGILVAEKTELQSQLAQSQKISEQRLGKIFI